MSALETIYQEPHEPEALGFSKILLKPSTLFAIFLLDYILPELSKLSKSLQTEKLDLSHHLKPCGCYPAHSGRCTSTCS